jgi:hypothetical protein
LQLFSFAVKISEILWGEGDGTGSDVLLQVDQGTSARDS